MCLHVCVCMRVCGTYICVCTCMCSCLSHVQLKETCSPSATRPCPWHATTKPHPSPTRSAAHTSILARRRGIIGTESHESVQGVGPQAHCPVDNDVEGGEVEEGRRRGRRGRRRGEGGAPP